MKPYAGLGHLSKSENLKIKAGVARAIEAGKPPLTAALQAMKDAWEIGGPIAAARFAKLCLRHCHERPKRIAFAEDTLRALHETPMERQHGTINVKFIHPPKARTTGNKA